MNLKGLLYVFFFCVQGKSLKLSQLQEHLKSLAEVAQPVLWGWQLIRGAGPTAQMGAQGRVWIGIFSSLCFFQIYIHCSHNATADFSVASVGFGSGVVGFALLAL